VSKQFAKVINGETWYSAQQVAETFAVTTDTVRRWISSNKIPATKINNHWYVKREDVLAMANRRHGVETT